MTFRVQQIEGELRVVFSPEAIEALQLSNGAEVEVRVMSNGSESGLEQMGYATLEQVIESHRRTEPLHSKSYRELAK